MTLEDMTIRRKTPKGVLQQQKEVEDCSTGAYPSKLFRIQHNPSVQPTVVSPLILRQLRIRSNVNTLPATNVVNNMSMVAQR